MRGIFVIEVESEPGTTEGTIEFVPSTSGSSEGEKYKSKRGRPRDSDFSAASPSGCDSGA